MKPVVFVIWRPWLGAFLMRLLVKLQAEYRVRLYVKDQADAEVVIRRFSSTEVPEIVPLHQLYSVACQPAPDPEAVLERAKRDEEWLGTTFSRLSVADRHFGRGFALGGARFPTSPQSRATRVQVLNAFSSAVCFWREEFENFRPVLVIGTENVLAPVAERLGVPVREPTTSRHASFFYWAESKRLENSQLRPTWERIISNGLPCRPLQVQQGEMTTRYLRTRQREAEHAEMLRKIVVVVAARVKAKVRGRDTSTSYDLRSNVAYLFRRRRQLAAMTRPGLATLETLKRRRFVFFPLATEPETTLQALSPEYFFQLETIAAIARELPADVTLVVKEHHPACGARADLFYEQISAFKAVEFADIRERGVDLIRQAEATITISGSAGFEAATMGKPTIVLGRNNIYDFLPHVRVLKDIANMGAVLSDALEGRLAGAHAKKHGAALLRAIEKISWNMEEFDPFSIESDVSDAAVNAALEKLRSSLREPASNEPAHGRERAVPQ